jgi:hypothetical protein
MAALLFKISDSFKVPGRGLVLVPATTWPGPPPFDQGQTVELRRPNGSLTKEPILYIGHLSGNKNALAIGVMIPESASVTPDTEIWSCD